MKVLEPKVIIMPVGESHPGHAAVYTKHEWDFMQKCKNGGIEVNVKLRSRY